MSILYWFRFQFTKKASLKQAVNKTGLKPSTLIFFSQLFSTVWNKLSPIKVSWQDELSQMTGFILQVVFGFGIAFFRIKRHALKWLLSSVLFYSTLNISCWSTDTSDKRPYDIYNYRLHFAFAAMAAMSPDEQMKCEFYDLHDCGEGNKAGCNSTEVCDIPESGKRVHCYALWKNDSGIFALEKKVRSTQRSLYNFFSSWINTKR